ncbi:Uncharacterized protein APZ42_033554, partial [Daphnia magna]
RFHVTKSVKVAKVSTWAHSDANVATVFSGTRDFMNVIAVKIAIYLPFDVTGANSPVVPCGHYREETHILHHYAVYGKLRWVDSLSNRIHRRNNGNGSTLYLQCNVHRIVFPYSPIVQYHYQKNRS